MREAGLQYLMWIKRKIETTHTRDVVNLATSGVATDFANKWLGDAIASRGSHIIQQLDEPNPFGLVSLKRAIREAYGLSADRDIVCTLGASGAIRLICEMLLAGRNGAEIVVESPAYEPLRTIPERFGARVIPADRVSFLASAMRALSDQTVAIFLTNPHNPTGHWLRNDELLELSRSVKRNGSDCRIVVDETFLDVGPHSGMTAALVDRGFVTLGSLSKSCGLSSLSCGWITADSNILPGLVDDAVLFHNIGCKLAEILGTMAVEQIDDFRKAARSHLELNHALVSTWLNDMAEVAVIDPLQAPISCVVFPRLTRCDSGAELVEQLEVCNRVLVTPGSFFGDTFDDCIRIGFGGDHERLKLGLTRLAEGLIARSE